MVAKLWSRTQQYSATADGSIYFHLRNSESRACPRHLSLHSESDVYGQLQGVTRKRLKQGGEKRAISPGPPSHWVFQLKGRLSFIPTGQWKLSPNNCQDHKSLREGKDSDKCGGKSFPRSCPTCFLFGHCHRVNGGGLTWGNKEGSFTELRMMFGKMFKVLISSEAFSTPTAPRVSPEMQLTCMSNSTLSWNSINPVWAAFCSSHGVICLSISLPSVHAVFHCYSSPCQTNIFHAKLKLLCILTSVTFPCLSVSGRIRTPLSRRISDF